jgi:hypothetical protein
MVWIENINNNIKEFIKKRTTKLENNIIDKKIILRLISLMTIKF